MASCFECSIQPLDSIKCGEFRGTLRNFQLFKNDSVPWSSFGRTIMLTAGKKYACNVVFHIGLCGVFELSSSPWRVFVLHKLIASLPVNK